MMTNNSEDSVKESVLINVFEMFVKRLDEMQDSINKMNNYLINEARYKTNDIIAGSIFNYPFEIHNFNFDKKMYAYVYIKLNNNPSDVSLYDIWWSIFDNERISIDDWNDKRVSLKKNLDAFMLNHFGKERFDEMKKKLKLYIDDTDVKDEYQNYVTCKHYDIDTLYDYLPEYVINEFVTKQEKTNGNFKSFNHLNYCISINFANENKSMFIDELVDDLLVKLGRLGYKPNDFQYIKIVGTDYFMHNLLSFYDMNVPCTNKEKQQSQTKDYIEQLCHCTREKMRAQLVEYAMSKNADLPFFEDMEDFTFIMETLRYTDDDETQN